MDNVVQFPSKGSSNLELQELVGSNNRGVISSWLTAEMRARLRVRVLNLRKFNRAEWPKTQFRYLGDGVWEIKWKSGKVQCRALGFDRNAYFVMVLGCTDKDNVYDPANCVDTAKRRKREVDRGEWTGIIIFEP